MRGVVGVMRLALAVVTVVLLGCSAPAWAGEVSVSVSVVEQQKGGRFTYVLVRLVALPGEHNQVAVSGDARAVRVSDIGAAPVAGDGCTLDEPTAVRCPLPLLTRSPSPQLEIDAGDEHDTLTVDLRGVRVRLLGGDGDDRLAVDGDSPDGDGTELLGGDGDDTITGGRHFDVIEPGPGADVVDAGGGKDWVRAQDEPGGLANDRLSGGPGTDFISYGNPPRGVRVDLSTGEAGKPGERDIVGAFENVHGTVHADVLIGDEGQRAGSERAGRRPDRRPRRRRHAPGRAW